MGEKTKYIYADALTFLQQTLQKRKWVHDSLFYFHFC